MSFFSDLFGGSKQRRDITIANANANASLQAGLKAANARYQQAANVYTPYTQSGEKALSFYNDAIGLNGDDARTAAESTISSDPLFTGKLAQDQNALLAYENARGDAGGGRAYAAGQQNLYQNYGDWLNRYVNQAQLGLGAANGQAGVYSNQAGTNFNYGVTKAGNDINYGNAIAGTRNTGVNNLLGLLGTGISGYNALYNKGGPNTGTNALVAVGGPR